MNRAISWFAENGVAANLLMFLILAAGILTAYQVKQEVFPEIESDLISISVLYPGAAPEEVEEAVCVRIEEQVHGIEGVKRITSQAVEGVGVVMVEVFPDADLRRVLDDVKNRVDAIDSFPDETEKPVVTEILIRRQVINVAVSGPADEATLKRLGEQVRDEISSLPGITQVELAAARPYEISIEVSEEALRRHGLTFDAVAAAVRRSSLDLPGGAVKTRGGEILLRAKSQAYRGRDFEGLTLLTRRDGTRLLLRDVARVVDGFAETDQFARFDGQPAVLVQVFRVGEQSALELSERVREYVRTAQARMPEGIQLTTWLDDAQVLRSRLDLLLRNGRAGLILVLASLALFLRLRLAFWVSLGIPISFLGAVWLMPTLDVSINLISLFAFIVVLGIVVDAAIVVGENIYTQLQRGMKPLEAAVQGAREMSVPVIFGVLTSVAAFAPLLFLEGNMGKFLRVIPLIVIPTLLFSLVACLLILPSHLSRVRFGSTGWLPIRQGRASPPPAGPGTPAPEPAPRRERNPLKHVQRFFSGGLEWVIERLYRPFLRVALEWRYLTVSLILVTLLATVGLVAGGRIKFSFFPSVEGDNVVALVTMPLGTPVEMTADAVRRLEESAELLRAEIDDATPEETPSVFRHALASIGEQPFRAAQSQGGGRPGETFTGSQMGEVNVQLAASEEREVSSAEVARRWRELTGPVADAVELTFTSSLFSSGDPINVQLAGRSLDDLSRAAEELKGHLARYPGVYDVADTFRAGKRELTLRVRPEAEVFGIAQADLARQVRQAFYGEEAQRVQRGRDEVKVMVRYPESQRRSLGDLERMRIRLGDGTEVPFFRVADLEFGRGFSAIQRVDRRRAVNVTAEVDENRANANEILAELEAGFLPGLMARYPALTYSLEGQQREQRDTLSGMARGFVGALIMIYALLAIPLRSYSQPLLIMSVIPFGIVGAVWGHVLMGLELTVLSMFGVVALAGVVVNGSLIMVDFVNRSRRAGTPRLEAVWEAGAARFRPILLTTLTTFLGLTPLLLETSLQARFLIPMAISLAFGVVFATVITLLLIPCGYLILEDLKQLFGRQSTAAPQPASTKLA